MLRLPVLCETDAINIILQFSLVATGPANEGRHQISNDNVSDKGAAGWDVAPSQNHGRLKCRTGKPTICERDAAESVRVTQ